MIRKDPKKFANGIIKTQIRVVYGYRDSEGKAKQKTLKSFGYLEDAIDQNAFMKEVEEYNKKAIKEENVIVRKTHKKKKPFYEAVESRGFNFGYKYIESIYNELGLEELFANLDTKCEYDLNNILKYLVMHRILRPDSKRATFQTHKSLYGFNCDFSLQNIYRSLSYFSKYSLDIQEKLNNVVKEKIGRNGEKLFYDVTNYSTQRDYESEDYYVELGMRVTSKKEIKDKKIIEVTVDGEKKQYIPIPGLFKKGVSKDHSLDPIVQLGLFIDENGLPVAMNVFPGNTSDCKTLQPIMNEVKNKYGLKRIIIVADKGLNTTDNISLSLSNGNGYMFSQILRGKKGKRYQERLFDESLYTVVNSDYKYQLFEEEYTEKVNNIEEVKKRKVLIYYSGEDARREKRKRKKDINKLRKDICNNAYGIIHGKKRYLLETNTVKKTGEVANDKLIEINDSLIEEDEKYDGYFCIITSELDYDESTIREVYHGLWRIEESFRITKSDLLSSPIFLRDDEHVRGHFLMCYISLLIIRLLQYKLNYSISCERIIRALKMCNCAEIDNGVVFSYMGETLSKYVVKKNEKNEEIPSMKVSLLENETINDFKEILKLYEGEICDYLVQKKLFDNYFNNLRIKSLKK